MRHFFYYLNERHSNFLTLTKRLKPLKKLCISAKNSIFEKYVTDYLFAFSRRGKAFNTLFGGIKKIMYFCEILEINQIHDMYLLMERYIL